MSLCHAVLDELRVKESEKNEQKKQKGKHGVTRQKKVTDGQKKGTSLLAN